VLVNCDAKALEWVCASYLSGDPTAHEEIWNQVDQHSANQSRFKLPSRLIAKTFVFRLIYGGSAYSYANDPDFTEVSRSEKFWQGVIDEFYNKYQGINKWHESLVREASTTGMLRMPTGRIYHYSPVQRGFDLVWPRTTILNYPVQGLGADLMCIARVSFANRFKAAGIRGVLISTVHDSIVVDVHPEDTDETCQLFHDVFDNIPSNFEKLFKKEFNLPTKCSVSYGKNLQDMKEYSI
jgi:DNA polymerase I-like protein with 3'-5' exonuclease and polymerase domains